METDIHANAITQKLLSALGQFHRLKGEEHTVAGCKPSEIRVLFCIKHRAKPGTCKMRVSEISKQLHVTSPSITQLLKSLRANGLIERHIDLMDRRAVDVILTQKGEEVTQQAWEGFLTSLHELVEYLGEEQSNQLAELLFKVFGYYKEKVASANISPWNGEEVV